MHHHTTTATNAHGSEEPVERTINEGNAFCQGEGRPAHLHLRRCSTPSSKSLAHMSIQLRSSSSRSGVRPLPRVSPRRGATIETLAACKFATPITSTPRRVSFVVQQAGQRRCKVGLASSKISCTPRLYLAEHSARATRQGVSTLAPLRAHFPENDPVRNSPR